MKYLVGYQLSGANELPFTSLMEPYWDHISEVFFPWVDSASGRNAIGVKRGYTDWGAQQQLEAELMEIRQRGVKLDLLFNANCYGGQAISEALDNRVASVIERLTEITGGPDVVTTASVFIADRIKKRFPHIEVRASVNMWIGTVKAMEYLSDIFDSFYVQREYNRDLSHVKKMSDWCRAHGKKLYMLANSGCLNFCTGHTFHDNLVAHEKEVAETRNVEDFRPMTCWRYLAKKENRAAFLQNSWVRPEDIHHYEGLVAGAKLATRNHSRPGLVVSSYVREKFPGNLLDLCEPGFGPLFDPYIIDNTRLPEDFFEKTSSCDRNCHQCVYCKNALDKALVKTDALTLS